MKDLAEVIEALEDIKETKKKLLCCFKDEISNKGLGAIDTKEAGEVVDMIKDLASVEKDCLEALYYMKVVEAMVNYEEPRYGYNANRSSRTGRYMSKGPGPRMGFEPHTPFLEYDNDMTGDDYMREAMMGYSDGRTNYGTRMEHLGKENMDSRYGRAYNEYKNMRKHYTETKSPEDRKEMNTHAEEHVHDSIATIRDIWEDADPVLKKRMKEDFTKLVNEMTV